MKHVALGTPIGGTSSAVRRLMLATGAILSHSKSVKLPSDASKSPAVQKTQLSVAIARKAYQRESLTPPEADTY